MAHQTAKFYIDMQAEVYAEGTRADYGVDRSPSWTEYHSEEVDSIWMWVNGKKYRLPAESLPEELKQALIKEAIDSCYSDEWVG